MITPVISLEGLDLPSTLPQLGAIVVSLALFAWFTSAEVAILSINRVRLRHLAEQGSVTAEIVQQILVERDRFFASVVLLQNLLVILASSLAAELGIRLWGNGGVLAATAVMTVVVVMVGEFIPKSLAAASESYALAVARPLRLIMKLLSPLTSFMMLLAHLFSRRRGQGVGLISPFVTEDELRMLITIGAQEGTVEPSQKEWLHRVFQFADRRVLEVMTPRTEIIWLEAEATLADFWTVYKEAPHSRFPVFEDSVDDVIGIVSIKDVLMAQARNELLPQSPLRPLLRKVFFIPETKLVGELFAEMQANDIQMAVAVDEFGGTGGIVTLEQLLEEIVGRVGDELAHTTKEFETIDEKTFRLEGGMRIDDVNEALGLSLPEGEYETVAGFILHQLGRIPDEGDQLRYNGLRIVITEMKGLRIERLIITVEESRVPPTEDGQSPSGPAGQEIDES